jgi:acyl transferase domain-containing protein/3-hydroxymyristoyl/3-hydroxydecanoyl-(acyl carrier protein) dehydratase
MEFEPVAIVGRSCVFPGASTPDQLWDLVVTGRHAISSCPENRWRASKAAILAPGRRQPGRACTDRGGYVLDFAGEFEPRGFAIDPAELSRYDESVRWVLHAARQALRDARLNVPDGTPARTAAIFGLLCVPTEKFASFAESFWMGQPEDPLARFNSGLTAHLLARALKLDGGAFALDAACASSLYAIQLACEELQTGRADCMLAGAVSRGDDLFLHAGFSTLEAISLTGQIRPFHRDADGLLPAEGAAFVALKRLSDAVRDGNAIHAIIRGVGISNDGRSASLMTPSETGQEIAIRAAYRMAGIDPAEVSLIECHATGTPVGDACELRSTGRVFDGLHGVPIGSVKSNLGHPMTAAGMAGLLKLLGAFAARTRPATLHVGDGRDQIAALASSAFRLVGRNEPWDAAGPRMAALSAFGFGGNNAHLIVEEWAGQLAVRSIHPMPAPRSPVAIVSLGVIAGDCGNLDQFTRALFGKGPGSRRTEAIELELDGLGFPPSDLENSLGQQVMALSAAGQALAGAGDVPAASTGVYIGLGCDPEGARLGLGSRLAPGAAAPPQGSQLPGWVPASVIGGLANIVANRVSSRFNLGGPSFAIMAEELSGLVALRLAARALQERRVDLAVAGAVDLCRGPVHQAAARAVLPIEKHEPGDAAVFLALKRLEDAELANDRIYAVFDADDATPTEELSSLASRFGHAHAASAMLDAAAAVLECAHGARVNGRPWIVPTDLRRVQVRVEALGGAFGRAVFAAHPTRPPLPLLIDRAPRIFVYPGVCPGDAGSRLVIVAANESDLDRKRSRALDALNAGASLEMLAPEGIYYRRTPVKGELAFVFPGAAAAYHGAGRSLLLAFPDVVQEVIGRAPDFAPAAAWIFEESARQAAPHQKLASHTLLCQAHATVTLNWFRLRPQAGIGFSAGETNTLLAFHVWRDPDRFFSEFIASGVFTTHLSGQFAAVNGTPWETWVVLVSERRLREMLDATPQVRLLAIHASGEYLIAGPGPACASARAAVETAQRIDFDMVVHCPDLQPFADTWRSLHHRETFVPEDGPRFYQLSTGRSYALSRPAIAEALTAQALQTLDFPRVVEQAWNDGVRVFLEHGPRGSCTAWIRKILGDREHVAIALDLPGVDSLTQMMHAAAQLIAAGVDIDLAKLEERISAPDAEPLRRVLRLPVHPLPVKLPMPVQLPESTPPPFANGSPGGSLVELHMKRLAAEHAHFQEISTRMHEEFLATSQRAFSRFVSGQAPASPVVVAAKPVPASVVFTRAQLELAASGKISQVYGSDFEELDSFRRICRLPMPPLLLVDRVTRLEGEPRSMKLGVIHTETDVRSDSWFLHRDAIPAGLMIEAGQADMLLISWLGADFHARGERVYRMLGCEVQFHDRLARSGETLRYEIRITGHARQGDARIFFFQYDCFVGDRLALSVRNGQAGFFSDAELRGSTGVLWSPEPERLRPGWKAPLPRVTIASQFTAAQVSAAAEGRIYECFGKGFELGAAQQRPPSFARPELLLFDAVTALDTQGGPWRRGHCQAEYAVRPDSWLFSSHFKDDPCLPGTIMLEGCLQLMAFYMMALGLTMERDGWRFEPVRDQMFELRCRGQVTPESRLLICDMFVDDFIDGPEPVLYADVLGTVDGLKAFHGRRIGLKLVPGNPLDAPSPELDNWAGERKQVARVNQVPLDYKALLACAWGLPSKAFGQPYARFDMHERCPRLPGPPYHSMTRITQVDGDFGIERVGSSVEAEFALDPTAWYFALNGTDELPFSVLLEAGLQPCGWLSCFTGIPLRSKAELYFRNLDGTARIRQAVPARAGTLTTRAKLTNVARQGTVTLVSFDVQMSLGAEALLEMKTGFGFFTRDDLARQAGLPPSAAELATFSEPCEFSVDLAALPAKYFDGPLRLATGKLLMIDQITGLWRDPDGSSRGRIRGSREVRPTDWYFQAHFYQDPVQPGSLGLEALIETLQLYAIHCGIGGEFQHPRFETSLDSVWKYRGQVTPLNRRIETEVRIVDVKHLNGGYLLKAEGWLWVDGVRIYQMPQFGLSVYDGSLKGAGHRHL